MGKGKGLLLVVGGYQLSPDIFLCSNRPKGEQRIAQAFRPGNKTNHELALKAEKGGRLALAQRQDMKLRIFNGAAHFAPHCVRHLLYEGPAALSAVRAILLGAGFPGLKAWALLSSPFGRAKFPNSFF